MRLQEVAAPGRRGRAVHDAAKEARHEARAIREDIAHEQVVALAGLEVGTEQIAFATVLDVGLPDEVVGARRVRCRHQPDDGAGHRIETICGNRVVREREARQRVADSAGKDAVALIGCGHPARAQHALGDPRGFDVSEEERAIAQNRAAEVEAELVLVVGGLREVGPLRKERALVELLVAEVVVRGAEDFVRPRLGRHHDGPAGRAAVLGGKRARHHLELVDRVD